MKKNIKVIQSIQRAINILNCFDKDNLELSLNEISQRLDLNINTTRGLVNSLVANDLIEHNIQTNTYSMGAYFALKSNLVKKNNIIRAKEVCLPYLIELTDKFTVSSRLQIITLDSIFTATTINPKSHYILESTKQENFPLHATSSGKIFIKYRKRKIEELILEKFTENTITDIKILEEEILGIEKNGYSTEFDEIGFGISSIAVPIFDANSEIFGTISVTALTQVIKEKKVELIETIKEKVKDLEKELFYK